jgi:hypothetical protein
MIVALGLLAYLVMIVQDQAGTIKVNPRPSRRLLLLACAEE